MSSESRSSNGDRVGVTDEQVCNPVVQPTRTIRTTMGLCSFTPLIGEDHSSLSSSHDIYQVTLSKAKGITFESGAIIAMPERSDVGPELPASGDEANKCVYIREIGPGKWAEQCGLQKHDIFVSWWIPVTNTRDDRRWSAMSRTEFSKFRDDVLRKKGYVVFYVARAKSVTQQQQQSTVARVDVNRGPAIAAARRRAEVNSGEEEEEFYEEESFEEEDGEDGEEDGEVVGEVVGAEDGAEEEGDEGEEDGEVVREEDGAEDGEVVGEGDEGEEDGEVVGGEDGAEDEAEEEGDEGEEDGGEEGDEGEGDEGEDEREEDGEETETDSDESESDFGTSNTMMPLLYKAIKKNDPVMTTINVDDHMDAVTFGYEFGSALLRNTHIQSIEHLDVTSMLFSSFDTNHMFYNAVESTAPFVKYIRTSNSLRRLHLTAIADGEKALDENIQEFLRRVARAVRRNKCIDEIDVDIYLTATNIARFFGSSIKSFSTRIWDFGGADGMDHVLRACGKNRTLETLALQYQKYVGESPAADAVAAVVLALVGHPKIRVLSVARIYDGLDQHRPLMAALATFVGGTPSLKHLKLESYRFNGEHMAVLLESLSTHRLSQLSLLYCKMDPRSFQMLASYVQTSTKLKKLALTNCPYSYEDLLIGSSLQVLDLSKCWDDDLSLLFIAWGTLTENIRLPCLRLWSIPKSAWRELSFLLPNLIYLRELHFCGDPPKGAELKDFIDNIKKNGSLQKVRFKEFEDQTLKTVCSRNRMLGGMIKKYGAWSDVGSHSDKMYRQSLFPLLLRSASKIQRMGPHFMFGLLSMNMSIGVVKNDGKRSATMS